MRPRKRENIPVEVEKEEELCIQDLPEPFEPSSDEFEPEFDNSCESDEKPCKQKTFVLKHSSKKILETAAFFCKA